MRKRKKRKKKTPRASSHYTRGRTRRRHRQWHVPGSLDVFPSFVGRPERPGILVGMEMKDSYAVAALVMCFAGSVGGDAPRVVFPSVGQPRMLCIIANMDQMECTLAGLVFPVFLSVVKPGMLVIIARMDQKERYVAPCRKLRIFSSCLVIHKDVDFPVVAQILIPCSADQRDSTVVHGQGG